MASLRWEAPWGGWGHRSRSCGWACRPRHRSRRAARRRFRAGRSAVANPRTVGLHQGQVDPGPPRPVAVRRPVAAYSGVGRRDVGTPPGNRRCRYQSRTRRVRRSTGSRARRRDGPAASWSLRAFNRHRCRPPRVMRRSGRHLRGSSGARVAMGAGTARGRGSGTGRPRENRMPQCSRLRRRGYGRCRRGPRVRPR